MFQQTEENKHTLCEKNEASILLMVESEICSLLSFMNTITDGLTLFNVWHLFLGCFFFLCFWFCMKHCNDTCSLCWHYLSCKKICLDKLIYISFWSLNVHVNINVNGWREKTSERERAMEKTRRRWVLRRRGLWSLELGLPEMIVNREGKKTHKLLNEKEGLRHILEPLNVNDVSKWENNHMIDNSIKLF